MLRDTEQLSKILTNSHKFSDNSIGALLRFIESKLHTKLYTKKNLFTEESTKLHTIAKKMYQTGIISSMRMVPGYADEPIKYQWSVTTAGKHKSISGGLSQTSSDDALVAALAEAMERFLWFECDDFFINKKTCSVEEMKSSSLNFIHPDEFVGISHTTRKQSENERLKYNVKSVFTWIESVSLTDEKKYYVPAQLATSGHKSNFSQEPIIRLPITTGLATWTNRQGALLRGILEVVERDAYMISWLNQLSLPQINLNDLLTNDKELNNLINDCEKFGFKARASILPTDLPTYVVLASVEDTLGHKPGIIIGLKAGQSLSKTVSGALLEALRMRQNYRHKIDSGNNWDENRDPKTINHTERILYWGKPSRNSLLKKLHADEIRNFTPQAWDQESDHDHYHRLVDWLKTNSYQTLAVSLGNSKKNISPWNIEMVLIPRMQPMHQNEAMPYFEGERIETIPKKFAFEIPERVYQEPHPFA